MQGHDWHELIVGGDGQQISIAALNLHDDTFDHVRQYQFHQKERGALTLRLVRDDGFGPREEQRIRERMKERLGSLRLDLEFTEQITTTTPGKWK